MPAKHKARAAHAADKARRMKAAEKQKPLPLEEQKRRMDQRQRANALRYPFAPTYR